METAVMPVQKGGRKRWTVEQKLSVLREWKEGLPVQEVCRRYGLQATQLYRWKRALERGLGDSGELIPKGQVVGLQRKVEELERALGRKSLEVDILKKVFELKGLKPPEGT
ncbi:MAG: transposase [candidate division Zixibacteria bacterium]|nr:transposase [candidate division Zixibacteria bacterium]